MADVTIPPSNVVPSNGNGTNRLTPANLVAGEAINAGEIACLLASDNKLYKADANDADKQNVQGWAGNSAVAAGQRVDIITDSPLLTVGTHGVALGTTLYLSATAGKICPFGDLSSTNAVVAVAFAATTTALQIFVKKSSAPKA